MAPSRLQVVDSADDAPPVQKSQDHTVAVEMMMMALKALSQRALVALASLFTLAAMASVFALAWVMVDPNILQLTKLGMYGLFVLAALYVVRRRS